MKYLLLMYANESEARESTPQEQSAAIQAWSALGQEATAAGVLLSSSGLAPTSDATTVRVRNGKTLTTDGPFAETHEQLAGYFLMECKDLDEAIGWAARIPMAQRGSIEIRPLWSPK